ncbi:MAG: hypothetical protein ACR2FE_02015 [Aeromicrobium sp.]
MVEERRPTKKVVKKVVRKTVVVRPAQTGTAKVRPASSHPITSPIAKLRAKSSTTRRRPSIRIPTPPRRPGAGLAARARLVGTRVGERAEDARFTAGRNMRRGFRWLRDLRLPHLSPLRGSAITGIVVGLLAVVLGWLSYLLLSTIGTASAGGGWGALILVVVAFMTYAAGELLLEGFGVEHARVVSATSIMLMLVLVLMFFLELAAGGGAWILLPLLGVLTFVVSCRVMHLAADQPNPR